MSTELIVILSIVGGAGLIGLFYVSHTIEKQRRQRALLIANLSDYAFRLQRLLDAIPPPYMGKDIQLLLYDSKSIKFLITHKSDKVRLKPVASGFQHGSPVQHRRRYIEPVNKRGRHADFNFNSNSRRSLELECSKGEL